jgi:hypothetical protein
MKFFLRRWRPRHLLLAWMTYWVGLILFTLWPAVTAAWRMSDSNSHGSITASVTDGILRATITETGHATWSGSITLTALGLLLAGPPLLLWLVWLLASSRTNNAGQIAPTNLQAAKELKASDRKPGMTESLSQTSIRQRREES